MWIAARMAEEAPLFQSRLAGRDPAQVSASMRAIGYYGGDVIVRNLSTHGFMVESRGDYAEGAIVRLKLPKLGTVIGRIVWRKGEQLGGEFVNPLPEAQVARLTRDPLVAAAAASAG